MKRKTISRKGWQRAVNALLWYPDNVQEYSELLEELTANTPDRKEDSGKPMHSDPTASAAMRLAADPRAGTLKQEIEAVELAVSFLRPEQKEVIRRRFWTHRNEGGRRKLSGGIFTG